MSNLDKGYSASLSMVEFNLLDIYVELVMFVYEDEGLNYEGGFDTGTLVTWLMTFGFLAA